MEGSQASGRVPNKKPWTGRAMMHCQSIDWLPNPQGSDRAWRQQHENPISQDASHWMISRVLAGRRPTLAGQDRERAQLWMSMWTLPAGLPGLPGLYIVCLVCCSVCFVCPRRFLFASLEKSRLLSILEEYFQISFTNITNK